MVTTTPGKSGEASAPKTTPRSKPKAATVSSDDEELVIVPRSSASVRAGVPNGRSSAAGPPPSIHGSAFRWSHVGGIFAMYIIVAVLTLWSHYNLPTPRTVDRSSLTKPAHFSEVRALEHIGVMSEDIGYRIVGTEEHVRAEKWIESIVKQYEGWHTTVVGDADGNATRSNPLGDTQVEVWTQIDDGAHRFDFMGSVVWKKYFSMSNVVVRISDGTDEGKNDAVLVNAHLDSTLPSPGAADDGAGIAILLELLRILTTAPRPQLRHSVILLFNNGEESLQDASHLYSVAHETRHSVRGVVNLEACGTSGPELLFQATSVPFVEAYAQVPHPFGTVLANDVFATGIILSDTDFRIFESYMPAAGTTMSGLDIAIVGNSYQYHTRQDVTANLQPGMMQHFGDNVLAIVDHLTTSPNSKLAVNSAFPKRSPPIYFSIAGRWFFLIKTEKFRTVVMGVCALSNYFLTTMARADKHFGALKYALASLLFTTLSMLVGLASSNVVALIMVHVIGKPLSWFSREWLPVLLFGPPALAGMMSVQYLFASLTRLDRRAYLERASLDGISLFFVLAVIGLSSAGYGTAYMPALGSVAITATIAINDLLLVGFDRIEQKRVAGHNRVHPLAYLVCVILPSSIGSEGVVSFLDLFVPLTGRTGDISPADHIVGSIVGVLTFLCFPFMLPLAIRMGMKRLGRLIVLLLSVSALGVAIFASPAMKPFNAAHPKRVFVHAVQNVTSDTFWINIGGADPDVKGLEAVVHDVHGHFGLADEPFARMQMDEYNPDFAILYPVSNFITPYKMRVAMPQPASAWTLPDGGAAFVPVVSDEHIDWQQGTRRLTLTLKRPDLIWSVMAFDAEILDWDLPIPPLPGFQRHHLKEVARHGINEWSVRMTIKLPEEALAQRGNEASVATANANPIRIDSAGDGVPRRDPSKLWIDYSALIAEAMWPQAQRLDASKRSRYSSIDLLEALDTFMQRQHPEADTMLLSVVAAVAQV